MIVRTIWVKKTAQARITVFSWLEVAAQIAPRQAGYNEYNGA